MASVTPQMVKDLREKTDLPMMECKQALSECDGSIEAAIDWLRRKHKGKLAERAGRATGEGRIGVYLDAARKVGAIVELQCETAPVAKNELFVALANAFAKKTADGSERTPEPAKLRSDPQLDAMFTDVYGKMRESMNLAHCRRVTGAYLSSYVHHDGKSGVMLGARCSAEVGKERRWRPVHARVIHPTGGHRPQRRCRGADREDPQGGPRDRAVRGQARPNH